MESWIDYEESDKDRAFSFRRLKNSEKDSARPLRRPNRQFKAEADSELVCPSPHLDFDRAYVALRV